MEIQKVSKGRIKYLQSLKLKKNRQKYAAFMAEGRKIVKEFIKYNHHIIKGIYALDSWIDQNRVVLTPMMKEVSSLSDNELKQISSLKTPDLVCIECSIPSPAKVKDAHWILYIDGIADPGNLGTIIRSADWFGVDVIYISSNTVEPYNPKVLQASMGSLARIPIHVADVHEVHEMHPNIPWFVADLQGQDINHCADILSAVLVIGSESHGPSTHLQHIPHQRLRILGKRSKQVDSLNAAIAASILMQRLIPAN